jgi:hypothetical protein
MSAPSFEEAEVFPPANPDVPEDDWPVFQLSAVRVYKDGERLANFLHACTDGPFNITGLLEKPAGDQKMLSEYFHHYSRALLSCYSTKP